MKRLAGEDAMALRARHPRHRRALALREIDDIGLARAGLTNHAEIRGDGLGPTRQTKRRCQRDTLRRLHERGQLLPEGLDAAWDIAAIYEHVVRRLVARGAKWGPSYGRQRAGPAEPTDPRGRLGPLYRRVYKPWMARMEGHWLPTPEGRATADWRAGGHARVASVVISVVVDGETLEGLAKKLRGRGNPIKALIRNDLCWALHLFAVMDGRLDAKKVLATGRLFHV
ncbi:MAG: hypothetical protein WD270_01695 [Acetobacterales bacterium]